MGIVPPADRTEQELGFITRAGSQGLPKNTALIFVLSLSFDVLILGFHGDYISKLSIIVLRDSHLKNRKVCFGLGVGHGCVALFLLGLW